MPDPTPPRRPRKKPQKAPPEVALARTQERATYGQKARDLFKQIIAPGAPDEHVALVFHYAKALELDPLRRQVMLLEMPRKNKDESARQGKDVWEKTYTIIVGVHGLIGKIQRHPEYAGFASSAVFAGEAIKIHADGTVDHAYNPIQRPTGDAAVPIGAWATVTRMLAGKPVKRTAWVAFAECVLTTWDKSGGAGKWKKVPRELWAKMPAWMNEKCAIAAAVRLAFDDVVGGAHVPEEFGGRTLADGSVEADALLPEPEAPHPPSVAEVVESDTVEGAFDEEACKAGLRKRLVDLSEEWGVRDKRDVVSRQLDNSLWLVDSEALASAGHAGPAGLNLAEMTVDQLQAAFDFVQSQNRASQARMGRSR